MATKENRLLDFVAAMTRLVNSGPADEARLLQGAEPLMKALVSNDDWLPDAMAVPHPQFYQQHLLYGDPLDRFSLVSFVWGPGQKTPVHDHTVWGIIGMLRGSECAQAFARDAQGHLVVNGPEVTLNPGDLDKVSPTLGDIHLVRNAFADRVGSTAFEDQVRDLALPVEFGIENMNMFIDWNRSGPFEVIRGEGECAV